MAAQWAFNEIVNAIAANLVSDGARASAVALASSCRSFEEPALREVWRHLDSLSPLVKCFPHKIWELTEDKILTIKRAPLRIEWNRFQQQYSSKVRRLVVSCWPPTVDSSVLEMFQIFSHHSPLLPSLVELTWGDRNICFLTLFFSKSLTSITVVPHAPAHILPPILEMLPTMAPDISSITVYKTEFEEEASSHLLTGCTRLRKYHVQAPLSTSTFSHAMQHPLLESLWLEAPIHLPGRLPDAVFPGLRSLNITSDEDFGWLKLLPRCSLLSTITVECPWKLVEQFMKTFQLTIADCGMPERLNHFSVRSPLKFTITRTMIACNLSLKNLTTLKILSCCSSRRCRISDISDQDIDLLTSSIPGLRNLAIGSEPCSVPSEITFNSLYTISSRCTFLKSLVIHFNPNSFITTLNYSEVNGLENRPPVLCPIKSISAGNIPLPKDPNVTNIMAVGLLEVFPSLEQVMSQNIAWKEIDTQIKVFRRIRNMG